MAIRLRYLGHNLVVPEGQFVIGRSSQCQLSIDDPLISRRHAILQVQGDGAALVDLGSRNGVQVNGARVVGQQALADGDTITVGGQAMTVHGIGEGVRPPSRRPDLDTQTISGFEPAEEDTSEATMIRGVAHLTKNPDKRVHELSLIAAVADKAIAMGRSEDAQRLLDRPLKDLLAKTRTLTGTSLLEGRPAAERAAQLALELAASLNKGEWIDYSFDLFTLRKEVMPPAAIDQLYAVLRKVRFDSTRLRTYLELIESMDTQLSASQRFLASRLEGLEALIGLK